MIASLRKWISELLIGIVLGALLLLCVLLGMEQFYGRPLYGKEYLLVFYSVACIALCIEILFGPLCRQLLRDLQS